MDKTFIHTDGQRYFYCGSDSGGCFEGALENQRKFFAANPHLQFSRASGICLLTLVPGRRACAGYDIDITCAHRLNRMDCNSPAFPFSPKAPSGLTDGNVLRQDHAVVMRAGREYVLINQPYPNHYEYLPDTWAKHAERVLPEGLTYRFADITQSLYYPEHTELILIGTPSMLDSINLDWEGVDCDCKHLAQYHRANAADVIARHPDTWGRLWTRRKPYERQPDGLATD